VNNLSHEHIYSEKIEEHYIFLDKIVQLYFLENCFSDLQNVILTHENHVNPAVVNYRSKYTTQKKKIAPAVVNYRGACMLIFMGHLMQAQF